MKINLRSLAFVVVFAAAGCATQHKPETVAHTPPTEEQMMEAFKKVSTPGEEHKLLQAYVGKWNHTVTSWPAPDAKPEVSTGTSVIEPMMGGRFIRQKVTGTMMGQPFEGLGITGFDNVHQQYSTVWLDSISTAIMSGRGTYDPAKQAIVDKGSFSCPLTPDGKAEYTAVWKLPKNNAFTYEMWAPGPDGNAYRMMEIVYKKAH